MIRVFCFIPLLMLFACGSPANEPEQRQIYEGVVSYLFQENNELLGRIRTSIEEEGNRKLDLVVLEEAQAHRKFRDSLLTELYDTDYAEKEALLMAANYADRLMEVQGLPDSDPVLDSLHYRSKMLMASEALSDKLAGLSALGLLEKEVFGAYARKLASCCMDFGIPARVHHDAGTAKKGEKKRFIVVSDTYDPNNIAMEVEAVYLTYADGEEVTPAFEVQQLGTAQIIDLIPLRAGKARLKGVLSARGKVDYFTARGTFYTEIEVQE